MKTSAFRSFLMVCLLALSSLAFADDADHAQRVYDYAMHHLTGLTFDDGVFSPSITRRAKSKSSQTLAFSGRLRSK